MKIDTRHLANHIDNSRHLKELEDLRYYYHENCDFWEWYEDKYGQTQKELFDEFEKDTETLEMRDNPEEFKTK
jgi:hypothetical protein